MAHSSNLGQDAAEPCRQLTPLSADSHRSWLPPDGHPQTWKDRERDWGIHRGKRGKKATSRELTFSVLFGNDARRSIPARVTSSAMAHYSLDERLLLTVCPGLLLYFCKFPWPLLDGQKWTPLGVTIPTRHRLSSTDQNWQSSRENWLGQIIDIFAKIENFTNIIWIVSSPLKDLSWWFLFIPGL